MHDMHWLKEIVTFFDILSNYNQKAIVLLQSPFYIIKISKIMMLFFFNT